LTRGYINTDELFSIRRIVDINNSIAESIAAECKDKIILCEGIENVIKRITVTLELVICSKHIRNRRK